MDDKIPILDFNSQLFLEKLKKELFGEPKMETKTETPGRAGKARKVVLTEEQFLSLMAKAIGEDRDAIRIWQTSKNPKPIVINGDRAYLAENLIREYGLPAGTKVVDTYAPRYIYFLLPDGKILFMREEDRLRGCESLIPLG